MVTEDVQRHITRNRDQPRRATREERHPVDDYGHCVKLSVD